jgi:hypothetical protein
MRHQKKCKVCGAPEEYVETVEHEFKHLGDVYKTSTSICGVCGADAGHKPPEMWAKPELVSKPDEYLKIKEDQAKVLMRAMGVLGVKCTHANIRKGLCIPLRNQNLTGKGNLQGAEAA